MRPGHGALILLALTAACNTAPSRDAASRAAGEAGLLKPVLETVALPHDPDDPAIWISPTEPARSLILGTDKAEKTGGLYVFNLDGSLRQAITPLDRPNNVDVEYDVAIGDERSDIAVVTERMQHRLRVFRIPADGGDLTDLVPNGLPVLEGQQGDAGEPMGVALYKRPHDGAVFAIVSPKTGGPSGYLWQYRLESASGGLTATLVRRFGSFSGIGPSRDEAGEIEAVAVDDELGYVYYSDEQFGIRKWHADPDAADAGRELAVFGTTDYEGDREGLAIFAHADGSGYLVSSDQVEGRTRLHLYPREGSAGDPHQHRPLGVYATMADETDGLEVTSRALPAFEAGLLVMMNSGPKTFQIYSWDAVIPAQRTEHEERSTQNVR